MKREILRFLNRQSQGTAIQRQLHRFRMLSGAKVKLVSVAKNESAYLAEWIFHHLYFGFDNIEVHTNHCTDDTYRLLRGFDEPRITVIDADAVFQDSADSPQIKVYRNAFHRARSEGYSHVMFLDIDEFWTPANFRETIAQWVSRHHIYDAICFNWINKTDEAEPFSSVFKESTVEYEPSEHVKTVYKSFVVPTTMNPHNVVDTNLRYGRDNGACFEPFNEHYSRTKPLSKSLTHERAFIVHRKYRSEKEYISMLGRGRPIGSISKTSSFKDNRHGYIDHKPKKQYRFGEEEFSRYRAYLDERLHKIPTINHMKNGQKFVENRYETVLKRIAEAPISEHSTLNRLLKNVIDPKALTAFDHFKSRHSIK